ncbi:hypothetical protein [Fluviicola taffensis]|uniref:Lipoprotein n=1 Tax=Fluviicola taffensis (strain DSM 16823 / NCIMB 13979 / RW262) TaxID=755732 RepID=F2IJG5_FLUTR|nr:hypothetical protein [Fluviicola taffensis]AEA42853.1 hypothetical protein Fluta_0852 [Fluviicola taffensis DSM 16823]
MKKLLGILAVALFVVLASASCKSGAHCEAYSSMNDQNQTTETVNR